MRRQKKTGQCREQACLFRRFVFILFLFMVFFSSFYCFGQGYLVHRYSETDGLPGSTVFDVTQDLRGRTWFATRSGVAVYDGFTWEKHTVSEGLPTQSVLNIQVDKNGRIWALCRVAYCDITVVYYNNTDDMSRPSWNNIKQLTIPGCVSMKVTSFHLVEPPGKGNGQFPIIAVGSRKYGLLLWNRRNREKWEIITVKDGLLSNSVTGIAAASSGERIYVATENGLSLLKLDIQNNKIAIDNRLNQALALPSAVIHSIAVEYKDKYADSRLQHNRVWLFGDGWLGYFKEGENPSAAKMAALYPAGPFLTADERVPRLLPDYRCGLYVGNQFELIYFNYNTSSWEHVDIPNGLICKGANSMTIDREKNIWIAGQRGVSKISSRRFSNLQMKHGLLEDEVTAVLEIEPGTFILGHNHGITFYRWQKKKSRRIYGFAGKLRYITTYGRGVYVYNEPAGRWKHCSAGGNINANNAYAVKKTSRGQLLVGTLAGLYILENETLEKFKSNDFQVDRPVYFILEDNKHRLWFGTDNGVIRWDGKKAGRYSLDHGLTGRETNRGAAIQDTQGRIWIGTTGGISIYDEAFDNDEHFNPPPGVLLLGLQTGEKKIPLGSGTGSIRLSHNNNTLVFHFRAISFMDETAIRVKKKLEQQLAQAQKMEAIGTLAGGIAHDFNNILGYSELMLDEIPEENRLHLQAIQIRTASERAAALVKQILAFSRQSKQERKPLKISLILKEALKLLRSTLPSLIEIHQDIRADSDIVLADVTQVHQIIMNLGTNAAHAMREKGGILGVTLDNVMIESDAAAASKPDAKTLNIYKNLKPGPYLRLTVSDTGHGIPPDVVKRIFDPFFTTKDPGEGTGMGLAVVHGIVKSHGGDISVYSEQGKGTSFHVYLPQMQGKAGTEYKPKRGEKMPGGSERILLVDDEAALTQMGKQMLENLGYQVVTEASGVEALEHFRSRPDGFHLVISDVTMPRMSGIHLAKEIKHINPGIPIILCSGYSSAITIEQIKAFGISDFIMKPIVKSELAHKVRKVLDKSRK